MLISRKKFNWNEVYLTNDRLFAGKKYESVSMCTYNGIAPICNVYAQLLSNRNVKLKKTERKLFFNLSEMFLPTI